MPASPPESKLATFTNHPPDRVRSGSRPLLGGFGFAKSPLGSALLGNARATAPQDGREDVPAFQRIALFRVAQPTDQAALRTTLGAGSDAFCL